MARLMELGPGAPESAPGVALPAAEASADVVAPRPVMDPRTDLVPVSGVVAGSSGSSSISWSSRVRASGDGVVSWVKNAIRATGSSSPVDQNTTARTLCQPFG